MSEDKLRGAIVTAMDDCFMQVDARPSQKTRILRRIEGEVQLKRKRSYGVALAMALVLALCGGVVAAELGIFGHFGLVSEWNSARLARLDEAANAVVSAG